MLAPCGAREVVPPQGKRPGVCRARVGGRLIYGFFVRYRRRRHKEALPELCEAVMELWVEDLSEGSKFSGFVPFVIDTGSQVIIVPRTLVPEKAFPRDRALKPGNVIVRGAGGEEFPGLLFRASPSVPSPAPKYGALSFQEMKIVVVDAWHDEYALLGLDALRRVVLTSDSDHVCLWPPRRGRRKGKGRTS
jgi:hypothetical protein